MLKFTKEQLVLYLSGQLRPILIPEMPLFLTFNTALVRKASRTDHRESLPVAPAPTLHAHPPPRLRLSSGHGRVAHGPRPPRQGEL